MDDPFATQPVPVIPDRVGAAAIQQRIDSARGMRGAKAHESNSSCDTGKRIRWMPTKASRHGSALGVRITYTWLEIFEDLGIFKSV